jgi:adenylyl-sulfate kinase
MYTEIGQVDIPVNGFSGCVVWLTGLSASGKSTLAEAVYRRLTAEGHAAEVLDGDAIRQQLSKDLGFTHDDRIENVRRIAFVANLLARHGVIVLVPVIAPYRSIRAEIRRTSNAFIEVYVNAPLHICEERDPKGLYRRARAGELKNFTGVSDPYEPPEAPDVECRTDLESAGVCAERILNFLSSLIQQTAYARPALP